MPSLKQNLTKCFKAKKLMELLIRFFYHGFEGYVLKILRKIPMSQIFFFCSKPSHNWGQVN